MSDGLIVEAEATWEIGAGVNGEVLEPFIVARIKNASGEPVTGLAKTNFSVYDMGTGFGSPSIADAQELSADISALLPGTYRVKLDLSTGLRGQLVFALTVHKSNPQAKGQALVAVVKLK